MNHNSRCIIIERNSAAKATFRMLTDRCLGKGRGDNGTLSPAGNEGIQHFETPGVAAMLGKHFTKEVIFF